MVKKKKRSPTEIILAALSVYKDHGWQYSLKDWASGKEASDLIDAIKSNRLTIEMRENGQKEPEEKVVL